MAHKSVIVEQEGYLLRLGDRGRLVLPSRLRKRLGLKTGEKLVLTVEDDGMMRLGSLREQLDRTRGFLASISPERCLSDELIRGRREENRRESE